MMDHWAGTAWEFYHQMLLKMQHKYLMHTGTQVPPVVLSNQDKLTESLADVCFFLFSCVEAKCLVMLISTDGFCQRQWRGMQMMTSPNMMVCCSFLSLLIKTAWMVRSPVWYEYMIFTTVSLIFTVLASIPIGYNNTLLGSMCSEIRSQHRSQRH